MLVAAGGAGGAGLRWAVVEATDAAGRFPWVTLLINVAGCLLLGLLRQRGASAKALLGTGFAGGLTTFSTLSVEVAGLLDDGHGSVALSYVVASLVAGVGAVLVGRRLSW